MTTKKIAFKDYKEYDAAMKEILSLMNKGEGMLSSKERKHLELLSHAAQAYEQSIYTVPPPSTLEGMIELKMYEMKLKQKDLAKTLGVSTAKLSLILNKKQKPDIPFIKALYAKLNVPAEFILQHV